MKVFKRSSPHACSGQDEISPSAKASASQGTEKDSSELKEVTVRFPFAGQGEPVQPSRDDLELDLERLMEVTHECTVVGSHLAQQPGGDLSQRDGKFSRRLSACAWPQEPHVLVPVEVEAGSLTR